MKKIDTGTDIDIDPRWGKADPLHEPAILANFKVRPNDVLITTPPKAGTTWMQQILHQLRTGGDPDFNSIDDVVPWLEIPREGKSWQQILQHFEALPEPRIFKTHCTAEQTPGIGMAKIILTSRDPRDCCVSFYHHLMNMTDEARAHKQVPSPASFDEHVDMWLEFAAWYRNVKSWWPYHKNPRVLWLRYQDMKEDIVSCIDQITAFLEWKTTTEQKERVLEYSSFDWMKAHDEKFSSQGGHGQDAGKKDGSKISVFKPGKFIRQGKVGKYRELMTEEQERRILQKAKDMLEPECLRFLELGI
jgi:hypothetical protein